MLSPATMPAKAFVLPHGPADQKLVEMAKDRVQSGPIEAPVVLNPATENRIPQEIEPFLGIPARPIVILAVDDTRLAGMDFQSTLREPTSDALQDLLRMRLRPAVRDNI